MLLQIDVTSQKDTWMSFNKIGEFIFSMPLKILMLEIKKHLYDLPMTVYDNFSVINK